VEAVLCFDVDRAVVALVAVALREADDGGDALRDSCASAGELEASWPAPSP